MFGTLEDMEELIQEAKKSRENSYHDYYVWRDGEEGVSQTI